MSSSWARALSLLLGALLQALWLGALAALLVGAPPAPVIATCWAVVAGAALLAVRARPAAPGGARVQARYRLLLVALALGVAAALTAAATPHGLGETAAAAVRSALFVAASLQLGLMNGRSPVSPERAVKLAVGCFVLVFAVVFLSDASHHPLAGQAILVPLCLIAGLALIALIRASSILRTVEGSRPVWRWPAGAALAGVLALALAVLVVGVPSGGALAWVGGIVIAALHGLQDLIGYAIGAVGYLVLRALTGVFGALHMHPHPPKIRPPSSVFRTAKPTPGRPRPGLAEAAGLASLAVLAVLALLLLVRSFRIWRPKSDEALLEEHEQLASPAAELRAAGSRLVGRLARLVGRDRARTPAEALRVEYRRLERSLGKAGLVRERSWTVRRYLGSLAAQDAATDVLVGLYERARYAHRDGGVDWREVDEFKRAGQALMATTSHAGSGS